VYRDAHPDFCRDKALFLFELGGAISGNKNRSCKELELKELSPANPNTYL
jgi:hypothetical protein